MGQPSHAATTAAGRTGTCRDTALAHPHLPNPGAEPAALYRHSRRAPLSLPRRTPGNKPPPDPSTSIALGGGRGDEKKAARGWGEQGAGTIPSSPSPSPQRRRPPGALRLHPRRRLGAVPAAPGALPGARKGSTASAPLPPSLLPSLFASFLPSLLLLRLTSAGQRPLPGGSSALRPRRHHAPREEGLGSRRAPTRPPPAGGREPRRGEGRGGSALPTTGPSTGSRGAPPGAP